MAFLLNFVIGFLAAFVGVIPPGLLNMSAAKITISEGKRKGILFSIGVCATVAIQTYVALLFARYLDMHPEIIDMLQKVALGIFICITFYFFFIAKDTRREIPEEINKSQTNRFFAGMFLGALNLFPLPYWVYVSITFSTFGWFEFTKTGLFACVIASALGTFVMLSLYMTYFRKRDDDGAMNMNINYIIGLITGVISVITAIKILNDF